MENIDGILCCNGKPWQTRTRRLCKKVWQRVQTCQQRRMKALGKNMDWIEVSPGSERLVKLKRKASRIPLVNSRTPPRNTRREGPSRNTKKIKV